MAQVGVMDEDRRESDHHAMNEKRSEKRKTERFVPHSCLSRGFSAIGILASRTRLTTTTFLSSQIMLFAPTSAAVSLGVGFSSRAILMSAWPPLKGRVRTLGDTLQADRKSRSM